MRPQVPLLRVFVKVLTFNDDSADAILKDPSAEIRATIHGPLLEEEGDALACGSTLVLRKVMSPDCAPLFSRDFLAQAHSIPFKAEMLKAEWRGARR